MFVKEPEMPLPDPLILTSPDYMSGEPVFSGTRVPIKAMFDYLEAGDPLHAFLKQYPTVSREHAVAVLEAARKRVASEIDRAA